MKDVLPNSPLPDRKRSCAFNVAQNGCFVRQPSALTTPHGLTRMVKRLIRPRARSISGVPQVVHGTESCLHARLPGWVAEKAGRCPCPDDCAPDDNGPHTREAHA